MTGSVFKNLSISPTQTITASQDKNESNLQVGNSTVESTTIAIASSLDKQLPVQGTSGNCNVEEVARQLIKANRSCGILSDNIIGLLTLVNQTVQGGIANNDAQFISCVQPHLQYAINDFQERINEIQGTINDFQKRTDKIQDMHSKDKISLEEAERLRGLIKDYLKQVESDLFNLQDIITVIETISKHNIINDDINQDLVKLRQNYKDIYTKIYPDRMKKLDEAINAKSGNLPVINHNIVSALIKDVLSHFM